MIGGADVRISVNNSSENNHNTQSVGVKRKGRGFSRKPRPQVLKQLPGVIPGESFYFT